MFLPPKRSSWITRATTARVDRLEIEAVDDEFVFQDLDCPFSVAKEAADMEMESHATQASVERIVAELATLLGPGKVSIRASDLEDHAADKWYARQVPDIVVFAESVHDVSKTLRFASKFSIPVTPAAPGSAMSAVACRWKAGSCYRLPG